MNHGYRRDQRSSQADILLQDVRFTLRVLRKNPRFTAIALLILALGIGANTAIFSLIEGVLLRPLNYPEAERLFAIREVVPKLSHLYPTLPANARHVAEWQKGCPAFEDMAQTHRVSVSMSGAGEPEQIAACDVSWTFFRVLGTQPQAGRMFLPEEDQPGRNDVAVLSDALWRRRFGADASVINNKVLVNGKPCTVVGILPASFRYPDVASNDRSAPTPEVFRPLGIDLNLIANLGEFNNEVVARVREGVRPEQALAELNSVQSQIASQIPGDVEMRATMQPLQDAIVGSSRRDLLVLFAAVAAILLIVCVNLANLLLARAKRRSREFAVRVALGAGPIRLARQLLTESTVLTLAGGALGLVLANCGVKILLTSAPVDLPRLSEVQINSKVLLFALLTSCLAGVLVGMLPALRLARIEPNDELRAGTNRTTEGRRAAQTRQLLVGAEVCISLVLVVTAGLLLVSFMRVFQVDKGFQTQNILTLEVTLPSSKYRDGKSIDRFYTESLERIRAVPGVASAGIVSLLPLQGESWVDAVTLEGDRRPITERPQANYRFVSRDYFDALGIALRAGRVFEDRDRNVRAAIVSESTARALWPGQNPIGMRFRRAADNETPFEVVGLVADVRAISLQQKPGLMVYVPYWERLRPYASIAVRTNLSPTSVVSAVRSAIWQVDDQVPVAHVKTMEQLMEGSVAPRRFQLGLVLLFALSALLLASIGIYGVVAESVASRTNEIGIRMALGANGASIRRMVLREGLMPVAAGMAVGVVISLVAGRILNSLLFEVRANDPLILLVAMLVMMAVAIVACYLPARKASRVDPLVALRHE
jgi:predicted permease